MHASCRVSSGTRVPELRPWRSCTQAISSRHRQQWRWRGIRKAGWRVKEGSWSWLKS